MLSFASRAAIFFAGLFGVAGTAGAAYAAHGTGSASLAATAAAIAFVHAPALLALGLAGERLRWPVVPTGLIILGVLMFSGDLGSRILFGMRLFANAAPIGGAILIFAWASICVLAFLPSRSR